MNYRESEQKVTASERRIKFPKKEIIIFLAGAATVAGLNIAGASDAAGRAVNGAISNTRDGIGSALENAGNSIKETGKQIRPIRAETPNPNNQ